jgi:hypothetical protein
VLAAKDLQRGEFALSTRRLELKVEELRNKHASELAELGRKTNANNQLRIEIGSVREQLRSSEQTSAANAHIAHSAEHALAAKQSELATPAATLEERPRLADSQQTEIDALMLRIQVLQDQLAAANNKARTLEEHHDLSASASMQPTTKWSKNARNSKIFTIEWPH